MGIWQKRLQKIILMGGMLAFVGSTAMGTVAMFTGAFEPAKEDAKTEATPAADKELQAQERGYEVVLKREPENQIALQGLVQARLEMNDLKGAVEPLEKLVKLNPNQESYKALLAEVKKRAGKD